MSWASDFGARLAAARSVGVVRVVSASRAELEVSRGLGAAREIANALASRAGLRQLGDRWVELSPDEARAAVAAALGRDLAYGAERMSATDAAAFAHELLARLGPGAKFLTNATFPTTEEAEKTYWRGSWDPLTSATFDVGVFGVGSTDAALLWVEDED